MNNHKNNFADFRNFDCNKLFDLLIQNNILKHEQASATVHALCDITQSIEKIFNNIIPEILNNDAEVKKTKDQFDDLREEFSHILYHIEDAKLFGSRYWE